VRDWSAEEGLAEPGKHAALAPLGYWRVLEDLGAHGAELARLGFPQPGAGLLGDAPGREKFVSFFSA